MAQAEEVFLGLHNLFDRSRDIDAFTYCFFVVCMGAYVIFVGRLKPEEMI